MDQVDRFSVSMEEPEKPVLLDRGERRSVTLSGTAIEGQWELGDKFLLLLSCDSPYDELVSICLLSSEVKLIDELHIGGWYNGGVLEKITARERFLEFEIFEYSWRVTLFASKKRFRCWGLPKGARRPVFRYFKPRYLALSAQQLVE